jgi:hypothetical protein
MCRAGRGSFIGPALGSSLNLPQNQKVSKAGEGRFSPDRNSAKVSGITAMYWEDLEAGIASKLGVHFVATDHFLSYLVRHYQTPIWIL